MKIILMILMTSLLFNINAFSKEYKINDIVEHQFYINKNFVVDLPKGKWILAEKSTWFYHGLTNKLFTIVKVDNGKIINGITITQWKTAGIYEPQVNQALYEIMFKNKYDGCYDKPKYTIIEFYVRGNTHNCFWVGHHDLIKVVYNPDDPDLRGANAQFKKWLKEKQFSLPKVALYSDHSYFSRLARGRWYTISYIADPKTLNAPDNKFIKEESSEYHKHNIDNYPEYKKIMKKWVSMSAQRHIDFEKSIKVLKRHRLNLNDLLLEKNNVDDDQSNNVVNQLQKLKDMLNSGILTKEEFDKAKKKILN
ncbi:SHOCT domain-containing protein [Pelagibacteraceae bacterium]|jgi:hypothetical protein|nr:SHOCT domain-containing protein [Pelagibacteraceae bacterium]